MSQFRVTIRYGGSHPQYELLDVEADDLRAAMRAAAERVSDEVAESAALVEIRLQADPDAREYVPD